MVITVCKLLLAACIVIFVYKFGYYEGRLSNAKKRETELYLPDKCDGCKKIKPIVSNLTHDRFGKITGVCISCSKLATCSGRKDKE